MKKDFYSSKGITLLLPGLICEMLSLCTSEERSELLTGIYNNSSKDLLGAILGTLSNKSFSGENKLAISRVKTALSIPACIVVNKILYKNNP